MSTSSTTTADVAVTSQRTDINATEVAQVMATEVSGRDAWPDAAVADLARLLGNDLAAPGPGVRRHRRLGLLIELVNDNTGVFIDTATYDAEQQRRAGFGEIWPTASALSRAYGHWVVAVRAAMRFWFDGGRARVAADHTHANGRERVYRLEEVEAAVERCRTELGIEAVTEWEYEQWRVLSRQAARRAGQDMPRTPSARVIRRLRGGWANT